MKTNPIAVINAATRSNIPGKAERAFAALAALEIHYTSLAKVYYLKESEADWLEIQAAEGQSILDHASAVQSVELV